MNIRAYTEAEKEKVLHLIPASFKEQSAFNMYMNWGTFDEGVPNIFVVEENGEIIGVMRVRKQAFHPYAVYLGISAKEEKCISTFIRYVEEVKKDKLPLIIRTSDVHPSFHAYEQCGFREMRRTYEATVQETRITAEEKTYPYEIVSLEDSVLTPSQTTQLVRLMKRCYTITHKDNPVGEFDDTRWRMCLEDEDVVKGASYVALDGGEVVAYVFAHDDGEGTVLELGWSGRHDEIDQQIITVLTKQQIVYARGHGYEKVMFLELDDTDVYSYPLLNEFAFDVQEPFITWMKGELK
ncbi:GNAT family N-acetyltransferase [Priestia taiwanensis]|uniref:N-acetyltransferase domain-containing protein n=1 Tax=Priestia taiwanensis TaxID=1347902 RepID=A0A917ARX0_9BACI|nr:GNAT family N-acetyltransferase [Priestia taiwanensis]MBM7363986.1 hypothetical protein [Priestia taiwanensis]GGE70755.1 hypothetical protein GCM10007140_20760 [Priestia taiwanensis]